MISVIAIERQWSCMYAEPVRIAEACTFNKYICSIGGMIDTRICTDNLHL